MAEPKELITYFMFTQFFKSSFKLKFFLKIQKQLAWPVHRAVRVVIHCFCHLNIKSDLDHA